MATIILSQVTPGNAPSPAKKFADKYPQAVVLTMCVGHHPAYNNIECLAPTDTIVFGHKRYSQPNNPKWAKWEPVSDEQYIDAYRAIIEGNKPQIEAWYTQLADTDVVILCCWCPKGKFCHRQLVAKTFEWLNRKGIGGHRIVLE